MKKIYEMIDGLPLYKHLKSGSTEIEYMLIDHDYGKFAEIIGKKIINYSAKNGGFSDLFPGISIVSINKIVSKRKFGCRRGTEIGDTAYEISYKDGDRYGKKVIIFEIKYGVSRIKQSQIGRYCDMIDKPGEYFHKADEVKVIYLFFSKIDTVTGLVSYRIGELGEELTNKILESQELREIKSEQKAEHIDGDKNE